MGVWGSSTSKSPKLVHEMPAAEFYAPFANEKPPIARVLVEVVDSGDEDDEEEEN